MSVAEVNQKMQARSPYEIAKACDELNDMDTLEKMQMAIEISIVEREIGKRVDYVANDEILEDCIDYLCPTFEVEINKSTSKAGNQTVTESYREIVWDTEPQVTIDCTHVDLEDFEESTHVTHWSSWHRKRAEITARCKVEKVGNRTLVHVSYEGVACG